MANKIPFNINLRQDIESGKYTVVTRDGRFVRIVCWDLANRIDIPDKRPVVGLIANDNLAEGEEIRQYSEKGEALWMVNEERYMESPDDLFLREVIRLSLFEERLASIFRSIRDDENPNYIINADTEQDRRAEALMCGPELLALARRDGWIEDDNLKLKYVIRIIRENTASRSDADKIVAWLNERLGKEVENG